ncbi:unnamed protein product [Vitrella brassicaformis CCMP3155]|uniref:Uncharacterized protein n=1 Tax=Vitrella brassicaformis (strain CCMP3155) TaxID=1169540 RepID=A0A0G4EMM6_VITBC|nr:unnamed protein product [Vitrella brassicaformis CCMP3155]|eukprot:CEL98063.1 unnamed protein product [Vitrella brassicaformis CCMP3155]
MYSDEGESDSVYENGGGEPQGLDLDDPDLYQDSDEDMEQDDDVAIEDVPVKRGRGRPRKGQRGERDGEYKPGDKVQAAKGSKKRQRKSGKALDDDIDPSLHRLKDFINRSARAQQQQRGRKGRWTCGVSPDGAPDEDDVVPPLAPPKDYDQSSEGLDLDDPDLYQDSDEGMEQDDDVAIEEVPVKGGRGRHRKGQREDVRKIREYDEHLVAVALNGGFGRDATGLTELIVKLFSTPRLPDGLHEPLIAEIAEGKGEGHSKMEITLAHDAQSLKKGVSLSVCGGHSAARRAAGLAQVPHQTTPNRPKRHTPEKYGEVRSPSVGGEELEILRSAELVVPRIIRGEEDESDGSDTDSDFIDLRIDLGVIDPRKHFWASTVTASRPVHVSSVPPKALPDDGSSMDPSGQTGGSPSPSRSSSPRVHVSPVPSSPEASVTHLEKGRDATREALSQVHGQKAVAQGHVGEGGAAGVVIEAVAEQHVVQGTAVVDQPSLSSSYGRKAFKSKRSLKLHQLEGQESGPVVQGDSAHLSTSRSTAGQSPVPVAVSMEAEEGDPGNGAKLVWEKEGGRRFV